MRPPVKQTSLPPHAGVASTDSSLDWQAARDELAAARAALAAARPGVVRQRPYDGLLAAERRCTELIHRSLATALELGSVVEPRSVLSLDVDGVLEGAPAGFSTTGLTGVAALRLLQLGRVAVVLNSGRSLDDIAARVDQFKLLGGAAAFGAAVWDGVFSREETLLSERAVANLARLRTVLLRDQTVVLDLTHRHSLRASRVVDGSPVPISGSDARTLLDGHGLSDLTFWVAPRHTDFANRETDKGTGMVRLLQDLGLANLPMAAIGDSACDLPMLRRASIAFLPAGTVPGYSVRRGQRVVRCRYLGELALWEAACSLVPSVTLQGQVLGAATRARLPEWVPSVMRRCPPVSTRLIPRLAAALAFFRNDEFNP